MLNYTRTFKRQLIFTFKGMRKENVNEAKNKDEKNKIKSNGPFGCLSNSYFYVKEEFDLMERKEIISSMILKYPSHHEIQCTG